MIISNKRQVGLALLISMVAFRSITQYFYVSGIYNVWHWILTVLMLLPIDGIIAGVYGFWSREKRVAFTIGFIPSVTFLIASIIEIIQNRWYYLNTPYGTYIDYGVFYRVFFINGGFAVSMGLMGFGLAQWKSKGKSFLVLGMFLWIFTLISMIGSAG